MSGSRATTRTNGRSSQTGALGGGVSYFWRPKEHYWLDLETRWWETWTISQLRGARLFFSPQTVVWEVSSWEGGNMSAVRKSVGHPEAVVEEVEGQVEEEGEEDTGQEGPAQAPGEGLDTGH